MKKSTFVTREECGKRCQNIYNVNKKKPVWVFLDRENT